MDITLIIPAYNEENTIDTTVEKALSFMKNHFISFQIIVIDDGSLDKTLEKLAPYSNEISIIAYPDNRGKGYALKQGLLYADGDYIFFTDADLAYDLKNIPPALNKLKNTDSDILCGVRNHKDKSYSIFRFVSSEIFQIATKTILRIDANDTQCGFKGFKKTSVQALLPYSVINGYGFDAELIFLAEKYHKNIIPFEIDFSNNKNSHLHPFTDSIKMLKEVFRIYETHKHIKRTKAFSPDYFDKHI